MTYSSDALGFLTDSPDEYVAGVPKDGTSDWTDWFIKVCCTRRSNLADFFLNHPLEKETQDWYLAKSMVRTAMQANAKGQTAGSFSLLSVSARDAAKSSANC